MFDVRTVKLTAVGPNGKALRSDATGETLSHPGWRKLIKEDDTDDDEDVAARNAALALSPRQVLLCTMENCCRKKPAAFALHEGQFDQGNGASRYWVAPYVRLDLEEHHDEVFDQLTTPGTVAL